MTDEFLNDISQQRIIETAEDFIKTASNPRSAMEAVVVLLQASVPYYDWVGIYILGDDDILRLGPYRGEPSPHKEIKIGEGICGAAVREKKTVNVPDVNADPRYLACSLKTKSELVVPIMKDGVVRAEIDIDSDKPDAFTDTDVKMLECIAAGLAELF